jgi:hypothetical protein
VSALILSALAHLIDSLGVSTTIISLEKSIFVSHIDCPFCLAIILYQIQNKYIVPDISIDCFRDIICAGY